jgi:metal-dependent amidase/aminoacylase/carboxypeptidase family protein
MVKKYRKSTTIAQKAAIIESLAANTSITTACKGANVNPKSYYNWLDNDPEFAAKCRAAMNSRIHVMKDVAFSNALKSSTDPRYQTSMLAWMNNEGGWVNPNRTEIAGQIDVTELAKILEKMNVEL